MKIEYKPKGVCAQKIEVEINGNVISKVKFYGGCDGNLKGISKLVEGQDINDVIIRLKGIKCGIKDTSCPDQFANLLEKYIKNKNKEEVKNES